MLSSSNTNFNSLTSAELASIIRDDAVDTEAKFAPIAEVLGEMSDYEPGSKITEETKRIISQSLDVDMPGSKRVTWVDGDGYVRHFNFIYSMESGSPVLTTTLTNNNGEDIVLIDKDRITSSLEGVNLIDEAADIIAEQIQSSELMAKLATQASTGKATIESISAMMSQEAGKLKGKAASFYSSILSLGAQLNSTSLTAALKSVYDGYIAPKVVRNKIEFSDSTYEVKSFLGTVIPGLILSGVEVISNVLLVAGGTILKIVGGVATAGVALVSNLNSIDASKTVATVKHEAMRQEFSQSLGQFKRLSRSYFSQDKLDALDEYGAVCLKYPFFNVYAWLDYEETGGETINCEVFINTLNRCTFTKQVTLNGVNDPFIATYNPTEDTLTMVARPDRMVASSYVFPLAIATEFGSDNSRLNNTIYGPMGFSDQDEYYKGLIARNCRLITWVVATMWAVYYGPIETGDKSDPNGCYRIFNGPNVENLPLMPFSPLYEIFLKYYKASIEWSDIVNTWVPFLRSNLEFLSTVPSVMAALFGAGNFSYFASNKCSIVPVSRLDDDFAIVPPGWTRGSMIAAAILVPLATAAVAGLAIAGTTKIRKWAMGKIADKQLDMNNAYTNYKENPDAANRKAYINSSIKYQKFSQWFNSTLIAPFSPNGILAFAGDANTGILSKIFGNDKDDTDAEIKSLRDSEQDTNESIQDVSDMQEQILEAIKGT